MSFQFGSSFIYCVGLRFADLKPIVFRTYRKIIVISKSKPNKTFCQCFMLDGVRKFAIDIKGKFSSLIDHSIYVVIFMMSLELKIP
jgi:hypothetical protein